MWSFNTTKFLSLMIPFIVMKSLVFQNINYDSEWRVRMSKTSQTPKCMYPQLIKLEFLVSHMQFILNESANLKQSTWWTISKLVPQYTVWFTMF